MKIPYSFRKLSVDALILGALALPLLPQSAHAEFTLVDDFESYNAGKVRDEADPPWSALGGTSFAEIDDQDSNKHLAYGWTSSADTSGDGWRGAHLDLGTNSLGATNTGTYFLSFRQETLQAGSGSEAEGVGALFGLTDNSSPTTTDTHIATHFNMHVAMREDTVNAGKLSLFAGDGASEQELVSNLDLATWYGVWLVVDNASNTFDVHFATTPGGAATEVGTDLGFDNLTTNALGTFFAVANTGDLSAFADNIHFSEGTDLANPIPEPSTYALIFGALALFGAAIRKRRQKSITAS